MVQRVQRGVCQPLQITGGTFALRHIFPGQFHRQRQIVQRGANFGGGRVVPHARQFPQQRHRLGEGEFLQRYAARRAGGHQRGAGGGQHIGHRAQVGGVFRPVEHHQRPFAPQRGAGVGLAQVGGVGGVAFDQIGKGGFGAGLAVKGVENEAVGVLGGRGGGVIREQPARDFRGDGGFAHAAGSGEGGDVAGAQIGQHLRHLRLAPGESLRGGGKLDGDRLPRPRTSAGGQAFGDSMTISCSSRVCMMSFISVMATSRSCAVFSICNSNVTRSEGDTNGICSRSLFQRR